MNSEQAGEIPTIEETKITKYFFTYNKIHTKLYNNLTDYHDLISKN